MRFFSIDIETTGLDPQTHGITEFACIVADLFDKSVPVKSFYRYVNPEGYVWSNYCLTLHMDWIINTINCIESEAKDYNGIPICDNMNVLYKEFTRWLWVDVGIDIPQSDGRWPESLTLAGKNVGTFDLQFLLEAGWDKRMFGRRILDPGPLYLSRSDKKPPELELCKKRAIASGCNIGEVVKHNALDDAMDVVKLLQHHYYKIGIA